MTLNFDSDVLRPTDMIVIDSILMIVEPSKDKLIHLFNLSTHRILFHLKGVEVLGQPFHPAKLYSFFPWDGDQFSFAVWDFYRHDKVSPVVCFLFDVCHADCKVKPECVMRIIQVLLHVLYHDVLFFCSKGMEEQACSGIYEGKTFQPNGYSRKQ